MSALCCMDTHLQNAVHVVFGNVDSLILVHKRQPNIGNNLHINLAPPSHTEAWQDNARRDV